jgi:AcrR family transcriptional regulator
VIVEAATRLFLERGYHSTSIGQIAQQAGVAVQTIYNSIGSKRDVLSRVLDFAAAGERAPVPVPQFMREQAEREFDPVVIIEQLVEFWQGALPRTAPVFRIIRDAAGIDPDAAALDRDRAAQRLRNYEIAARLLDRRGALRDGLTIDQAAAAIFAIGHPETYRTLVLDGDWDDHHWAAWARATLQAALIRRT